jgi:hypothetical protein
VSIDFRLMINRKGGRRSYFTEGDDAA